MKLLATCRFLYRMHADDFSQSSISYFGTRIRLRARPEGARAAIDVVYYNAWLLNTTGSAP